MQIKTHISIYICMYSGYGLRRGHLHAGHASRVFVFCLCSGLVRARAFYIPGHWANYTLLYDTPKYTVSAASTHTPHHRLHSKTILLRLASIYVDLTLEA